jgi:hypothetical protein
MPIDMISVLISDSIAKQETHSHIHTPIGAKPAKSSDITGTITMTFGIVIMYRERRYSQMNRIKKK